MKTGERIIDFISGVSKNRQPFKTEGVCAFKLLLKSYRGKQRSPFLMTIAQDRTKRLKHDAEEFVYIVSGRIELEYDGETYVFREGD